MNPIRLPALLALASLASLAQAHPGHGAAPGLASGLLHPVMSLDHLLAMLGIGLWSAVHAKATGPRAGATLPALFVGAAALGTALGSAGLFGASIEIAVAATLLPIGLALLLGLSGTHPVARGLVVLCGTLHGGAHGVELAGLGGAAAAAGFLAGTALLHATGIAVALALSTPRRWPLVAACGGGIATSGIWLLA